MKLTEWLQENQVTRGKFAELVGVDPLSVRRWEKGERMPVSHFKRISEVTEGLVTANDFVTSA